MYRFILILFLIVGLLSFQSSTPIVTQVQTLPKGQGIKVDGEVSDWKNKGLTIPVVANVNGVSVPQSFSAQVSLSWDSDWLYLAANIKDDTFHHDKTAPIWNNDGLEIFLSAKKGSDQMVQYLISPSLTGLLADMRVNKMDYRTGSSSTTNDLKLACKPTTNGYVVEVAVPFSSLNLKPVKGDIIALNFYLIDADAKKGKSTKYAWHYNEDTYYNHDALYELQLGDQLPQSGNLTRAWLLDTALYNVKLFTKQAPANKQLTLVTGTQSIANSTWQKSGDGYVASFQFNKSTVSDQSKPLGVFAAQQLVSSIEWLDIPSYYVNIPKPNSFEKEIGLFEKQDKQHFPPKGAVLFIGSSSIRMWKTLQQDFPEVQVINRGFGGSKTTDVLHFFHRIVTPYQPKTIVYYTGTNDLASGAEPAVVTDHIEEFVKRVHEALPNTQVIVFNHNMAVSRKQLVAQFREANQLLQQRMAAYSFVTLVDVSKVIMNDEGMPRPELFLSDSTHLNAEGYRLWTQLVHPVLLKVNSR